MAQVNSLCTFVYFRWRLVYMKTLWNLALKLFDLKTFSSNIISCFVLGIRNPNFGFPSLLWKYRKTLNLIKFRKINNFTLVSIRFTILIFLLWTLLQVFIIKNSGAELVSVFYFCQTHFDQSHPGYRLPWDSSCSFNYSRQIYQTDGGTGETRGQPKLT